MEIGCQEFHGTTIATNNAYPQGISGAKFLQCGVRVKYNNISEELYKKLFFSEKLDLKFRLALKGVAKVSWLAKEPKEVQFTLLSGTNPCPVALINTENGGLSLSSVEFFIDKVEKSSRSGFCSYTHYDFYWSAELLNGDEILCTVDSPVRFFLVAVSKGPNKRSSIKKRKLAQKTPAITKVQKMGPPDHTVPGSPLTIFPNVCLEDVRILLDLPEEFELPSIDDSCIGLCH